MLNSTEHKIYPAHICYNATIVHILTYISRINTPDKSLTAKKSLFLSILAIISSWNFMLYWVEHDKSFITSRPGLLSVYYDAIFSKCDCLVHIAALKGIKLNCLQSMLAMWRAYGRTISMYCLITQTASLIIGPKIFYKYVLIHQFKHLLWASKITASMRRCFWFTSIYDLVEKYKLNYCN